MKKDVAGREGFKWIFVSGAIAVFTSFGIILQKQKVSESVFTY